MANQIVIPRQAALFVAKETTKGTLVFPSAAQGIALVGDGQLNQVPTYTDSGEILNSRDVLAQFQDITPAGDWSFSTYVRPSGTAGTAPDEDVLWECALGTKTTVALTSVTYTPALTQPSFSLWLKEGNVVRYASGCTVDKVDVKSGAKGAVEIAWSGKFMKLGWAGESTLAEAITSTPDTSVIVANAKLFAVGAKIKLTDAGGTVDDNTGAGYTITNVSTATNTLTVSPGIAASHVITTTTVGVFLPTPTVSGSPVEARSRLLKLATVSTAYKSFSLTVGNGIQYLEDEVTTTGYPTDYAEGARSVDGSFATVFRTDDLARFTDGLTGSTVALVFDPTGTIAAGSKFAITLDAARLQTPKTSTSGAVKQLDTTFKGLATSGEDSIEVAFT